MNVVIPMAGRGSRLSGLAKPKPLVEVDGRPLFAWSTLWLDRIPNARVTFVALAEHEEAFAISAAVRKYFSNAECIFVPDVTEGQLCTVLCAAPRLDLAADLLVAPCDTFIDGPLPVPASLAPGVAADGILSVARMPGDRWSFAEVDEEWNVSRVTEKERISEWASTGLYYFGSAGKFVEEARAMVEEDARVRGEFYVMPLYGRMLARGAVVKAVPVDAMFDLGTPEALGLFQSRHLGQTNGN